MEDTTNVGNVTQPSNDETIIRVEKSKANVQIKVGEEFVTTEYTLFDDDSIDVKTPEGVDEIAFQEAFNKVSPEALKNKAGYAKNLHVKELEAQNAKLMEQLEGKTKVEPPKGNDVVLTPQKFGFTTQEELDDFMIDEPEEYNKRLPQIITNEVNAKIGKLDAKWETTQRATVLQNQAKADGIELSAYEAWLQEKGFAKNTSSYSVFREMTNLRKSSTGAKTNKVNFTVTPSGAPLGKKVNTADYSSDIMGGYKAKN